MAAAEIKGEVHWSKCCSHGISTWQKLKCFFWKPGHRPGKCLQQMPRLEQGSGELPFTPWHALWAAFVSTIQIMVNNMNLAKLEPQCLSEGRAVRGRFSKLIFSPWLLPWMWHTCAGRGSTPCSASGSEQLGAWLSLPETLEPVSHFSHCSSLKNIKLIATIEVEGE